MDTSGGMLTAKDRHSVQCDFCHRAVDPDYKPGISPPEDLPILNSLAALPRDELVKRGGFREDFPAAAWEDIEFAYRAVGDGLKIHYQPKARTLHRHCIRPRTFCRRQRTSGRSAAIFGQLHPELEEFLGMRFATPSNPMKHLFRVFLCLLVELGERVDGVVPLRVYQEF